MAKPAKSPLKPFVILITTSALVWAIFMAIHNHLASTIAEATSVTTQK
jgi:hypothetical protein